MVWIERYAMKEKIFKLVILILMFILGITFKINVSPRVLYSNRQQVFQLLSLCIAVFSHRLTAEQVILCSLSFEQSAVHEGQDKEQANQSGEKRLKCD